MKQEALLLIHLSSLDNYTAEKGQRLGEWLGMEMGEAIREYPGRVFVTDQAWEYCGKQCQPRKDVEEKLNGHVPPVIRFSHDEDVDEWEEKMKELGELLRSYGVTHLIMGGVWASEDASKGCVNETRRHLEAQGFACSLDDAICGWVEEEPQEML